MQLEISVHIRCMIFLYRQVANALISKVKEQTVGMTLSPKMNPGQQFISLFAQELINIMGEKQSPLSRRADKTRPTTILLLGLQGAGKTTAAAKLARWILREKQGEKVLLVAADTFR